MKPDAATGNPSPSRNNISLLTCEIITDAMQNHKLSLQHSASQPLAGQQQITETRRDRLRPRPIISSSQNEGIQRRAGAHRRKASWFRSLSPSPKASSVSASCGTFRHRSSDENTESVSASGMMTRSHSRFTRSSVQNLFHERGHEQTNQVLDALTGDISMGESVSALRAITLFKHSPSSRQLRRITKNHIKENAPQQVNIAAATRKAIIKRAQVKFRKCTGAELDEAETELQKLMKDNISINSGLIERIDKSIEKETEVKRLEIELANEKAGLMPEHPKSMWARVLTRLRIRK
jgi:hypothetical protein